MQRRPTSRRGRSHFRTALVTLAACLAFGPALAACGGGGASDKLSAGDAELAADLGRIPQDPFHFARAQGAEDAAAPLLDRKRREEAAAAAIEMFFSPWTRNEAGVKLYDALWGYYWLKPERGYMENLRPYSSERWRALAANADILNYPSRALPAITVERADLRLMPTDTPYFFEPSRPGQGYPFDYYQNSSLPLGTPVLVTHVSLDGAWLLVESPSAGGWVKPEAVALVRPEFMVAWKSLPMGTILRENTPLRPLPAGAPPKKAAAKAKSAQAKPAKTKPDGQKAAPQAEPDLLAPLPQNSPLPARPGFASIGAVLPLESSAKASVGAYPEAPPKAYPEASIDPSAHGITALYPVKGADGYALAQRAALPPEHAAFWPLELTKENMAALMAQMMGQPYGWGGYGGNRDCSSTLRDLFLSFGVWLPRNSRAQAALGDGLDLSKLGAAQKEEAVLREGRPFLSLVGLPGHIMLYLGEYEGRAAVFHNMWGLRTNAGGGQQGRAIIGKAVITSLSPGAERGDLASPESLLGNVNRLSFPLGSE